MSTYRRILALVAVNADPESVISRALQLARFHGSTLAIASVVDYTPGFEADHFPFLTAAQMKQAIVGDIAEKLDLLSRKSGAAGAEVIVADGLDMFHSWRPDLVVVNSRAPHGLDHPAEDGRRQAPHDVLVVQSNRRSYPGRLIDALASAF